MPPLSKKVVSSERPLSLARYEARVGLLFILPWLLGFVLLKLIPLLTALGFSFTDFYMLEPERTRFVGLANYAYFLRDKMAGASLFGSIGYFLLTVPLELCVALALAAIFSSKRLRARLLLRTLVFMPSILSAIAIYFIWDGLTTPGSGWIDRLILRPLNLPSSGDSLYSFLLMNTLWSIGPGFLIMLGAMQGINPELYEAARVDGAGPLTRFFSITIPLISPAIFFTLVINLTGAFGGSVLLDRGVTFRQVFSPMESYINYTMFSLSRLGYASALTWVMFLVTMTITVILFQSARRWVYFPEETTHESF